MLSEVLQIFEQSTLARFILGALFLVFLGRVFLGLTRKSGKTIFAILSVALIILFLRSPLAQIIFTLLLVPLGYWLRKKRVRANEVYEVAIVRMEGGGIKRGLAAAEAGILLGKPFNITLTVAILGMLHKRILKQVADSPLSVEVEHSLQTRRKAATSEVRADLRRRPAQNLKVAIHPFEELFLELLEQEGPKSIFEVDFGIVLRPFLQSVVTRLGGFGVEESRDYYAQIIKRAPLEARSEGELIKDRERVFDHNFGLILLGSDFDKYLDDGAYSYHPAWLRSTDGERIELSGGLTFAQWASEIMVGMKTAMPEKLYEFETIFEGDSISTSLMEGILKATYFG